MSDGTSDTTRRAGRASLDLVVEVVRRRRGHACHFRQPYGSVPPGLPYVLASGPVVADSLVCRALTIEAMRVVRGGPIGALTIDPPRVVRGGPIGEVIVEIRIDLVGLGEPLAGLGAYLASITFVLLCLAFELLGSDPCLLGLGSRISSVGLSAAGLDAAHLGLLAQLACAEPIALDLLGVGPVPHRDPDDRNQRYDGQGDQRPDPPVAVVHVGISLFSSGWACIIHRALTIDASPVVRGSSIGEVIVEIRVDLVSLGEPFAGLGAYLTGIAFVLLCLALELLGGDARLLGLGPCSRGVGLSTAGFDGTQLGLLAELAGAGAVTLDGLRVGPVAHRDPDDRDQRDDGQGDQRPYPPVDVIHVGLPLSGGSRPDGCAPYPRGNTRFRRRHTCGVRVQLPRDPTARAMTSSEVNRAAVASTPINTLARALSGIVSVGLKALELVSET